jgi:DNA ligase 1
MFVFQKPQSSQTLPLQLEPLVVPLNNKRIKKVYKLDIHSKWYMSEKLDGIRAIWTGKELLTKSMRQFTYVPEWFLKKLPRGNPLDGELYIKDKPFSYFSSLSITKESPEVDDKWKEVKYYIFDMPISNVKFDDRLQRLTRMLALKRHDQIEIIEFKVLNDIRLEFQKVNDYFKEIIERNGEGVMLIKADSLYEPKRSKNSLKYKKEHRGEAKIIEYHEGLGKYSGKLGKYKCELLDTHKTFFCGSGINDEIRNKYTFDKTKCVFVEDDAPKINDIISYSALEILPSGVPRMAIFKALHRDT